MNRDFNELRSLREEDRNLATEITRENPEWVRDGRIEYLESQWAENEIETSHWQEQADKYGSWFGQSINKVCVSPLKKQKEKILQEIEMWRNPKWKPSTEISEESIANAKSVPMDRLIQFNKAGFANCLWHSEKHASMKYWVKENKVKCFGCGKLADSIEVARHLYDYDFKQAVNYLNGI